MLVLLLLWLLHQLIFTKFDLFYLFILISVVYGGVFFVLFLYFIIE